MKKTIILTLLLPLLFSLSSCFKKSEQDQVKEQLESLAEDLSFEKNVTHLKQVLRTKKIIEKYFHRSVQMKIEVRESNFNIPNAQALAQNLFLLNKVFKQLSLEFQGITVSQASDEKGVYYIADFEIDAVGKEVKGSDYATEEIPFQFYLRKFGDDFLIFKGNNPPEDEEL